MVTEALPLIAPNGVRLVVKGSLTFEEERVLLADTRIPRKFLREGVSAPEGEVLLKAPDNVEVDGKFVTIRFGQEFVVLDLGEVRDVSLVGVYDGFVFGGQIQPLKGAYELSGVIIPQDWMRYYPQSRAIRFAPGVEVQDRRTEEGGAVLLRHEEAAVTLSIPASAVRSMLEVLLYSSSEAARLV